MTALLVVIVIIEGLLLALLMAKVRTRYDGNLLVDDNYEKTTLALEIETDPEKLIRQKSIKLKVVINPDE